jgi:hypothetical protein
MSMHYAQHWNRFVQVKIVEVKLQFSQKMNYLKGKLYSHFEYVFHFIPDPFVHLLNNCNSAIEVSKPYF